MALLALLADSALASNGWQTIHPEGTGCWDGAPWQFQFRPGPSAKLAVYFEGGGACWNATTCDPRAEPSFGGTVTTPNTAAEPLGKNAGLLDFDQPGNPLTDWNVAFLPYCTGDAHVGDRDVVYERGDGSRFTVRHRGQRNTRAALAWLESRLIAQGVRPEVVLVTGESAGAIAAAYWAIEIGDRLPTAELVVIGDAAGGYRTLAVNATLEQWYALKGLADVPAYRDRAAIYFETFYLATAQHRPDARLAQVNYADDAVQRRFRRLIGSPVEQLTKDLTCNLNEIRRDTPGFHSYIYPGTQHAMLRTPAFYHTSCEGQRLADWFNDVLVGRPVVNRWCDGSAAPFANVQVPRL